MEVMLSSAQIPFTIFNIQSYNNNNIFTLFFPTGATDIPYATFFITIEDLNSFMQNMLFLMDFI